MHFGNKTSYGTPFYLNNQLAGWICTTINGLYTHVLAHHHIKSEPFKTELQCKLNLMRIFGE